MMSDEANSNVNMLNGIVLGLGRTQFEATSHWSIRSGDSTASLANHLHSADWSPFFFFYHKVLIKARFVGIVRVRGNLLPPYVL